MERLTIEQARARIAANTGPNSLVDPKGIDWTQPGLDAVVIAGLVQSTDDFEERHRVVACALALVCYECHLAFEAGRESMLNEMVARVP